MSIWLKFVRVRSLPACSPRGHVVSRAVSEASRSAEEVLSQEVQVHLSVRRILPFFSQPDVVSLSDRVSLVTPNFTWFFFSWTWFNGADEQLHV